MIRRGRHGRRFPHRAARWRIGPKYNLTVTGGRRSDYRKLGLDLTGEITQKTIRNIREKGRSRGRGQAKGAGIESVHLVSRKLASDGSLRSLRDAVILLVMSDAMLRGSELLQPRVGHISEESDKSGRLELTFTTKTIKKGDAVQYLGASTMRIVNEYIKMVGLTEGDKLVVGIDRWDRPSSKDISMRALNKIVRRLGQDHFGEHLSSHSFRVGSAQTLSSKGAILPELQPLGGGSLQRCQRTTVGNSLLAGMQWQSTSMDNLPGIVGILYESAGIVRK